MATDAEPDGGPAHRQVPEFTVQRFADRKHAYCLGIPVLNENGRILKELEGLQALGPASDIVIADGGSTDGSTEPTGLAALGVTALLTKTGPGRLSAQLRMLFSFALDEGYEGVITIDGNGKDGLDGIARIQRRLEDGWDFVQGSRFIAGGHHANTPLDRRLGVRVLHAPLISIGARFRYTDTTNGLRGWRRQVLEDPRVDPFRDEFDTYNLHYYLSVRVPRLGYKVCEIPVSRVYPESGPTPTKISGLRSRAHVLGLTLSAVLGRYNPRYDGSP